MGKVANPSTKVFSNRFNFKMVFNEPKMLFKNVHALWIMLGTTTRGDAHFCYTFWIFESMHKYLIWSCLNYINILMAPKMLGIGEGLWNIISRCHKYFQHLWKCFNISFRYKTNVRNRKRKQEKEKAYLALTWWPNRTGQLGPTHHRTSLSSSSPDRRTSASSPRASPVPACLSPSTPWPSMETPRKP